MTFVAPAIWFALYYAAVMVLCGSVFRWMDRREGGDDSEGGRAEHREGLAAFLIGTGFCPFVIGLFAGLVWLVAPGLGRGFYPGAFALAAAAGLFGSRRLVAAAWADLRGAMATGRFRRIYAALLIQFCLAVFFLGLCMASRPMDGYDATTYALGARRIAAGESLGSRLRLFPSKADNQFANHNHGNSYEFYLAASLAFSPDPQQEFALRWAVQILAAHVAVCVVGLALRISCGAAVISAMLFASCLAFGGLMIGYSRDLYRVLPMLILFGLFRSRRAWPGFNWRGLAFVAAMSFLWNGHASALMNAPLVFGCFLLFSPGARAAFRLCALFLVSIPLGAMGLARATIETGSPMGYSPFFNVNYTGTSVLGQWWGARGALPVGWSHALSKLLMQLKDGPMLVVLLWAALVWFAVWLLLSARHRDRLPGPPLLVVMIGVFLLVSELLLAGLVDPLTGKVSVALAMNFRYRVHFYVLGAPLIAYFIERLVARIGWRPAEFVVAVLPLYLLANGMLTLALLGVRSSGSWVIPKTVESREATRHLAKQRHFRWLAYFDEIPRDDLILMDYAYLGWYHTGKRIMFTQDPRLWPVFRTRSPEKALRLLDELRVKYVFMIHLEASSILRSDIALAEALRSGAFQLIVEQPAAWYLFRRVTGAGLTTGGDSERRDTYPTITMRRDAPGALSVAAAKRRLIALDKPKGGGVGLAAVPEALGLLRSPAFETQQQGVSALLDIGRRALTILRRAEKDSPAPGLMSLIREVREAIESGRPTGLSLLHAVEDAGVEVSMRYRGRSESLSGGEAVARLRRLAILNGVSVALPLADFIRLMKSQAFRPGDDVRVLCPDGAKVELWLWLDR